MREYGKGMRESYAREYGKETRESYARKYGKKTRENGREFEKVMKTEGE